MKNTRRSFFAVMLAAVAGVPLLGRVVKSEHRGIVTTLRLTGNNIAMRAGDRLSVSFKATLAVNNSILLLKAHDSKEMKKLSITMDAPFVFLADRNYTVISASAITQFGAEPVNVVVERDA